MPPITSATTVHTESSDRTVVDTDGGTGAAVVGAVDSAVAPPGVVPPVPLLAPVPDGTPVPGGVVCAGGIVTCVCEPGFANAVTGISPGSWLPPAPALPPVVGVGSNRWVQPSPASHTSGQAC